MRTFAPALALLLSACSPALLEPTDDGVTDPPDLDPGSDPTCAAEVVSLYPDGEVVDVHSVLTAEFSEAIDVEHLLLDIVGVPGQVTVASDGLSAIFAPQAPLEHGTSYEARALVCESQMVVGFDTALAPLDPASLDGVSWFAPLQDSTWEYPEVADILDLGDNGMLLSASREPHTGALQLHGAIANSSADGVTQSSCFDPVAFGPLDLDDNPSFVVGPVDMTLPLGKGAVLEDTFIVGQFCGQGDAIAPLALEGMLDTRTIDDSLCMVAEYTGEPCLPCSDGEISCLPTYLSLAEAIRIDGVAVDTSAQSAWDADCY
jgi:hypothetical protein